MIRILMSGCNGKMGQVITRLSSQFDNLKIVAGYDKNDAISNPYPVFTDLKSCNVEVDVVIDFSHPSAFNDVLDFAVSRKVALVMATTGLSQANVKALEAASGSIPVFFSANMSLGVNLMVDLVKKAAKVLENNFDIEIIEMHHNQKIDAPSGTALAIADAINSVLEQKREYIYDRHSRRKKRSPSEIGIHAIRGGTIVGDHSVIFAGNDEIIEIKHTAMSKEIFGVGALKAAGFIKSKKPGIYNMNDLVESM
ncbi:4-hydroxy-tetrahydrodipicolinate reductase [Clostridium thermosuccinogenes]|jgi:4-hydroxy-tetrahydrodipicolinate reductase|uniref:4-hydroxy-tetrahydrodipicolinate reductase n=1 Tax=Clostridium thermosuccinogenes TaxID=84032 RepID=UPI000CCC7843|nr:4-hydroxy-tetrahydrodipicolinate reductase [Pseudoclostridium thermosuccinogenes]PNT93055.1 4-hydroxy-tetrahydrodipicolinate reductase [Pseudoclostridium thermosuccinogenes]